MLLEYGYNPMENGRPEKRGAEPSDSSSVKYFIGVY